MPTINHEKFIKLLERNTTAAYFFIDVISLYSKVLDMDLIEQHGELNRIFTLNLLSRNKSLPWNESLIERYKDKWLWIELSLNTSLPWSAELLERFAEEWDWTALSLNTSLPWSEELLERFAGKWSWYELSRNESLP